MKYIVETYETQLYKNTYEVEAESEAEAREKIYNAEWDGCEEIDYEYCETENREIISIKPYED